MRRYVNGFLGRFASMGSSRGLGAKSRLGKSLKALALEKLENREVPTINDLFPAMSDLLASGATVQTQDLTLNNQQKATYSASNGPGEVDLYTFSPAWSGNYRFTANQNQSSIDTVLAVYNADGERIAFNDDTTSSNLNSTANVNLTAGVLYQVAVTSYDDQSTGDYTLGVSGLLQDDIRENNDTLRTATKLSSSTGIRLTGVMADAHDYYQFTLAGTAKAGSSLDIDFNHAMGDLDLRLLSANGTVLTTSDGVTNSEIIDLSGLKAGKYIIDVAGYNGAFNPGYVLNLNAPGTAVTVPGDAYEPNNALARATKLGTIATNTVLSNLSIGKGDVDYFQFKLGSSGTASSEVLLNFLHSQGDIDVELLNSAGKRVAISQSTSDQERFSLNGFAAGTYSLRVYGYAGATNPNYSLTLNHTVDVTPPVTPPPVTPPVTPPVNPPVTQNSWTVMVYMTATNLAQFGFADVNEMEDALTRMAPGVNFTLFWDQWNQGSYATGGGTQAAWGTAGRAVLQADSNMNSVATSFEIIGERNTGDPATLRDFLAWSQVAAPAQNYALVMWNHGGGLSGVNFDDESGNDSINITDLRSAITQSQISLQVLSYDACLMGMAEQAYEARGLATVQVASEEVIDGPGYNYRTAFQALQTDPSAVTAQSLAQGMVQSFTTSYGTDGFSTFSAIASNRMDAVATSLRAFTTAASSLTATQVSTLKTILGRVTHFDFPENIDLQQFMQAAAANTSLPQAVRTAAAGVVTAVSQSVLYVMADSRQTTGLAIYLPGSASQESSSYGLYSNFEAATGWSTFINRMLGRASSTRLGTGTGMTRGAAQRGTHHARRSAGAENSSDSDLSGVALALPAATSPSILTHEVRTVAANTHHAGIQPATVDAQGTAASAVFPTHQASRAIDSLFSGPVDFLGRLDESFSMGI